MKSVLNPKSRRVRITDYFETTAADMLNAIRAQGLEGVVGNKKDSRYEVGKRSGSWAKFRLNSGQELLIGGFIPGVHGVDAIVVGYFGGEELMYVGPSPQRFRASFEAKPASAVLIFAGLHSIKLKQGGNFEADIPAQPLLMHCSINALRSPAAKFSGFRG